MIFIDNTNDIYLIFRPGYEKNSGGMSRGLNKTCAQFVQVLHTDGDDLGTNEPIGHVGMCITIYSST